MLKSKFFDVMIINSLVFFVSAMMTTETKADFIVYTAIGNIALDSGPDTLGLDGANFTLRAVFNDTDTYVDRFGLPSLQASSDLLTIEGASVASTNGAFEETFGLVFYPTFGGQFFGGADGGSDGVFNNTDIVLFGNLADATIGVAIGDQIDVGHFGTQLDDDFPGAIFAADGESSLYNVTGFSAQASVVPEPASILGWLVLTAAFLSRRRRSLPR